MKLAVFGGTFNPPHLGHIRLLECAQSHFNFDEVLAIPDYIPPHKSNEGVVLGIHRMAMCKLAFSHIKNVKISDMEQKRQGKSYTVDTLRLLKTQYHDAEIYLIVGGDSLLNFKTWYQYSEILSLCNIVTMARDLSKKDELNNLAKELSNKIILLDELPVDASSTEYRSGMINIIPNIVEEYIEQNALYGKELKIDIDVEEIKEHIKNNISEKRANHIFNVADQAKSFAKHFGENEKLCYIAGLLHDIIKEIPKDEQLKYIKDTSFYLDDPKMALCPQVWHGFAAAEYIQEKYKIYNQDIINGIRFHSTGSGNMTRFQEIIYMADLVSAERDYPGVNELRQLCYDDFPSALAFAFDYSMHEQLDRHNALIQFTVDAYNRYLKK